MRHKIPTLSELPSFDTHRSYLQLCYMNSCSILEMKAKRNLSNELDQLLFWYRKTLNSRHVKPQIMHLLEPEVKKADLFPLFLMLIFTWPCHVKGYLKELWLIYRWNRQKVRSHDPCKNSDDTSICS